MRIYGFLGFGWVSIAMLVASGIGINLFDGAVRWALYIPFVLTGLHMTIRFRAFSTQPWRRLHSRSMMAYGPLAMQEFEAAKDENREFNIATPCRLLAERAFGEKRAEEFTALLGDRRIPYYKGLVESYPQVFFEGVDAERRHQALDSILRDVAASEPGPDIVIAKQIEMNHSGLEAARYLHALLLGQVR